MNTPTMGLAEAAKTLKIHPHSMEKLIRSGEIAAGKVGRSYVLLSHDVLAYAEKVILQQTSDRIRGHKPTVRRSPKSGRQVTSSY